MKEFDIYVLKEPIKYDLFIKELPQNYTLHSSMVIDSNLSNLYVTRILKNLKLPVNIEADIYSSNLIIGNSINSNLNLDSDLSALCEIKSLDTISDVINVLSMADIDQEMYIGLSNSLDINSSVVEYLQFSTGYINDKIISKQSINKTIVTKQELIDNKVYLEAQIKPAVEIYGGFSDQINILVSSFALSVGGALYPSQPSKLYLLSSVGDIIITKSLVIEDKINIDQRVDINSEMYLEENKNVIAILASASLNSARYRLLEDSDNDELSVMDSMTLEELNFIED